MRTWMHAVGSWGHAGVGWRRPRCAPAAEARPAAAAIGARRPRRHPRQPHPGPIRTIGVGGIGAPRPLPTCSGGREPVGRRVGGWGGPGGQAQQAQPAQQATQRTPAAARWLTSGCRGRPCDAKSVARVLRQAGGRWAAVGPTAVAAVAASAQGAGWVAAAATWRVLSAPRLGLKSAQAGCRGHACMHGEEGGGGGRLGPDQGRMSLRCGLELLGRVEGPAFPEAAQHAAKRGNCNTPPPHCCAPEAGECRGVSCRSALRAVPGDGIPAAASPPLPATFSGDLRQRGPGCGSAPPMQCSQHTAGSVPRQAGKQVVVPQQHPPDLNSRPLAGSAVLAGRLLLLLLMAPLLFAVAAVASTVTPQRHPQAGFAAEYSGAGGRLSCHAGLRCTALRLLAGHRQCERAAVSRAGGGATSSDDRARHLARSTSGSGPGR
jgi:hypothetical protein